MYKFGRFMRLVEGEKGYQIAFRDKHGRMALHNRRYKHFYYIHDEVVLLYDSTEWSLYDTSGDFIRKNWDAMLTNALGVRSLFDVTQRITVDRTGIELYYASGNSISYDSNTIVIGDCIRIDKCRHDYTILYAKCLTEGSTLETGITQCSASDLLKLPSNIKIESSEDGYYCTINNEKIEGNYERVMYNYNNKIVVLYNTKINKKFLLVDLDSEIQSTTWGCAGTYVLTDSGKVCENSDGEETFIIPGNSCISTGMELVLPNSIVISEDWYRIGEDARAYLNKTYSSNEELLYDCFYTMARPL